MSIKIVAPNNGTEEIIRQQKTLLPFNEIVLEFINTISMRILKANEFKKYPELVAMAFWMRKTNLQKLKDNFVRQRGSRIWRGKGTAFHIAPSNVDTIFIYSWFISMLVGNINIIRLSSNLNDQIGALLKVINETADQKKYAEIKKRFLIVQYDHNDDVSYQFSAMCDIRVIWGGDKTINKIRAIPISPATTELIFSDKFSFSMISAEAFLACNSKDSLINKFFNDAYWFNQNACSSPKLVVWKGDDEKIEKARSLFWRMLEEKALKSEIPNSAAAAVEKLVVACSVAISSAGDPIMENYKTNILNRVLLDVPEDIKRDIHCGGGFFYEIKISNLEQLTELVNRKDQTMSYYGLNADELRKILSESDLEGLNRIVPIGDALNFSAVWDGYDLLREFCREICLAA